MATGSTLLIIGCSNESREQAQIIEERADQQAERLEESAGERADAMKDQADQLERRAEEQAEALRDSADKKASRVRERPDRRSDASTPRSDLTDAHSGLRINRDQIIQAQSKLQELGYYSGRVDGVLGKDTREAVKRFQEQNDLAVTSQIDSRTLARLNQASG